MVISRIGSSVQIVAEVIRIILNRVIDYWNRLTEDIATCTSVVLRTGRIALCALIINEK